MPTRKVPPSALRHATIVPHDRETRRLFTRLSKSSLISLAKSWLEPSRVNLFAPNFEVPGEEGELSLEEMVEAYDDLDRSTTIRAKDVAERMLENEWRDGATLLGIAELEWQFLIDHPASCKWQSFALSPLRDTKTPLRPRFHTPSFLTSLQSSLKPLQTAHFFSSTHPTLPLTMIRVSLHDPFTLPTYPQKRKMFWLAFPEGADHIFTTLGLTKTDGLYACVASGIENALSRAGCRFELKPGRFMAKTLESMMTHRGAAAASGGMAAGWSIYVDGFENSPLALPKEVAAESDGEGEEAVVKKRRKVVAARFGKMALDDGAALESAHFVLQEKFKDEEWTPKVEIRLEGSHVFAGIRQMAENGVGVNVEKLPGWMVGGEGVSSAFIREGKVFRRKADGKFSRV
ncbi:centromere protein Chl4/mis15/CENP-N [Sphaerosporella brunnea]|uniref:Centromere protein Chl4/mis15/CENP-N n=1 Tax=Sphaerosporella brunnea TaxID=1250544 RepID=A0A5J5EZD5_9PEZI|nr:centromere protein Chl4/mis15/CENP-N [Sphaerosporella brunnea]